MNHYTCMSCCPPHMLMYRDLHSCFCDSYHYRDVPSLVHPVRTRPVLLKPPMVPFPVPRAVLTRTTHKEETHKRTEKTFLKFGIESILAEEPAHSKPSPLQAKNGVDTSSEFLSQTAQETAKKPNNAMPPKRAVFSDYQRRQLEMEFLAHKYISKQERKHLANRLHLSESQVRIWFQNRRMKWRNRQEREMMRRQRISLIK